jgi:hypothetical protein
MTEKSNLLDHIDTIEKVSFKTCAGLGCRNKPDKVLQIRFVDKQGHFCQPCVDYLLQADLAFDPIFHQKKEIESS